MTDFHPLSIQVIAPHLIEAVNEKFLAEGLRKAREKTLGVNHEIYEAIKPGITEDQARRLALTIFADHGVHKHWHKPYIRFGKGTALTFHEPLQETYLLQENDPFYIDLGPIWVDEELGLHYEGDYGNTYIYGTNPSAQHCINTAHRLFKEAEQQWLTQQFSGEAIYAFLKERAAQEGYLLKEEVNGHRLSDFPHHQYSKERLSKISFPPQSLLWVLEIQLVDVELGIGAFYEDILDSNCPHEVLSWK